MKNVWLQCFLLKSQSIKMLGIGKVCLETWRKRLKLLKAKCRQLLRASRGERLVMETEAVQKEKASLESQLAALKNQINSLTLELDSQKIKGREACDGNRSSSKRKGIS